MIFLILNFLIIITNILAKCPDIAVVENFNVSEYIKSKWYIQKQQITSYLPLNTNYCVSARYAQTNKTVPFFSGKVLSVYNNADKDKVNGPKLNSNNQTLCARIPNEKQPAKLLVGPCFLPNILAGDYWVIAAGPKNDNYQWAIVSGGPPTQQYPDGCTTKQSGVNGSGLWLFSRKSVANNVTIETMLNLLKKKGYTTRFLNTVEQKNCHY